LDPSGTIRKAHIALGGVAHKPWRAIKAEEVVTGKRPDGTLLRSAAQAELQDAKTYEHNAFKVELARRCIVRSVTNTIGIA
jgi:xanthine dehydrogenase YagS FAD-binding subunit